MNESQQRWWMTSFLGLALMATLGEWLSADEPPVRPESSAGRSSVVRELIGTWRLASIEERDAGGKLVVPLDYGAKPVGLLMYDATGHMSVHIMRQGRPRLDSDDVHRATPEQARAAFVGFNGYFGTYEVDEKARVIIHHLEGCLIPNWEGSTQCRPFTLAGDKLILDPPSFLAGGQKRTRRVTWERVR